MQFINGWPVPNCRPNEVLSGILSTGLNLEFWSTSALKVFFRGAVDMTVAYCKESYELAGTKKGVLSRFMNKQEELKLFIPNDRQKILRLIYNTILKGERHSLLGGFGVTNRFGDKLFGSPEYSSVK